MSPHWRGGGHCFWCGSHWRRCDSFLSAQYLMNRMADFNQTCMDITLGHDEELIRFWWPWPNFQGHCGTLTAIFKPKRAPRFQGHRYKSALYKLFGNLCIVMQIKIGFLFKKSRLGFGNLDLIFKVTVEHNCQIWEKNGLSAWYQYISQELMDGILPKEKVREQPRWALQIGENIKVNEQNRHSAFFVCRTFIFSGLTLILQCWPSSLVL